MKITFKDIKLTKALTYGNIRRPSPATKEEMPIASLL